MLDDCTLSHYLVISLKLNNRDNAFVANALYDSHYTHFLHCDSRSAKYVFFGSNLFFFDVEAIVLHYYYSFLDLCLQDFSTDYVAI